jgi:hypothetical protein
MPWIRVVIFITAMPRSCAVRGRSRSLARLLYIEPGDDDGWVRLRKSRPSAMMEVM